MFKQNCKNIKKIKSDFQVYILSFSDSELQEKVRIARDKLIFVRFKLIIQSLYLAIVFISELWENPEFKEKGRNCEIYKNSEFWDYVLKFVFYI